MYLSKVVGEGFLLGGLADSESRVVVSCPRARPEAQSDYTSRETKRDPSETVRILLECCGSTQPSIHRGLWLLLEDDATVNQPGGFQQPG